jgi:DNA-binding transcriptional LysR family regulator
MKQLQTTLPGLLCAIHVAEHGGFSAAAKALNLSPAAVSKNIAALETTLRVRLFNRTTRTLSLTEEGRVFVEQARAGLEMLENAASVATQAAAPRGLVRVNCSVGFGRRYVLPALPSFFRTYTDVQVDLVLNDQPVDLVGQGFDIGIRGGSQPPEGMVARKICDVPSVLVATPRYLKQRGTPKVPSDLAEHSLLRVKFLNGKMYPWTFRSKTDGTSAVSLDARLMISDPEVILDAVLLHMGIARMGRHHAHAALASGELVEVLADAQVPAEATMTIFYPHRAGLAPRVRVLVDALLETFAKDPSLHATGRKRPPTQS